MGRKGTLHIVREGSTLSFTGAYRAVVTVGDNPAEMEAPQRELMGEQEVLEFLQQLLQLPSEKVRHYVDELMRRGRVRVEGVDEDWYKRFDRHNNAA